MYAAGLGIGLYDISIYKALKVNLYSEIRVNADLLRKVHLRAGNLALIFVYRQRAADVAFEFQEEIHAKHFVEMFSVTKSQS